MGVVSSRTFEWKFNDQATAKMKAAREEIRQVEQEAKNASNSGTQMGNGFNQGANKIREDVKSVENEFKSLKQNDKTNITIGAKDDTKKAFSEVKKEAAEVKKESASIDIAAKDKTEATFSKVKKEATSLSHEKANIAIDAHDKTGTVFDRIKRAASSLGKQRPKLDVSAKDQTTGVFEKIKVKAKELVDGRHTVTMKGKDEVSPTLDKISDRAGKTSGVLGKMFGATVAANLFTNALGTIQAHIGELSTSVTEYNNKQQTMNATWNTLTGSASKGKAMVDMGNQLSKAYNQDINVVDELNQQFYHVLDAKGPTEQLSKSVLTLGDTLNLSNQNVERLGTNFTHMMSSGKMQLGDFNMISDQLPMFGETLLDYEKKIQNNSKLTMSQLRDEMSAGKISAKDAENVMNELGKKYQSASENLMKTIPGMERSIKTQVPGLLDDIYKPIANMKNPLLGQMTKWLDAGATQKAFSGVGSALKMQIQDITKSFGGGKIDFAGGMDKMLLNLQTGIDKLGASIISHKSDIKDFISSIQSGGVTSWKVFTQTLKDLEPVMKIVGNLAGTYPKQFAAFGASAIIGTKAISGLSTAFKGVSLVSKTLSGISKFSKGLVFKEATDGAKNLTLLGKAFQVVGKFFLANPFAIAAAAIIAIGVAFYEAYKHSKTFRDSVNEIASGLKKSFTGAITSVEKAFTTWQKNLSKIWSAIGKDMSKGVKDISKTFSTWGSNLSKIWNALGKDTSKAFSTIGKDVSKGIKDITKTFSTWGTNLNKIWTALGKDASKAFNAIGKTITSWGKSMNKTWNEIKKDTSKAASDIWNDTKKKYNNLKNDAGNAISTFAKTSSKNWNTIKSATAAVAKSIWNDTKNRYNALKSDIGNILNAIVKTSSNLWNNVKNTAISIAKQLWDNLRGTYNNIKNGIGDILNSAAKLFSNIWNGIKSNTGKVANAIKDVAVGAFDGMRDKLSGIWKDIKKGFSDLWGGVKDVTSKAWDGIKSLAKGGMNGVIGFINGGISGIDKVIHFFGGSKSAIKKIPKLAKGTAGAGRITAPTLAVVNDEKAPMHREAIFRKEGNVEIPRGRDVLTYLRPGDEVMPAGPTAAVFGGLPHFKGGTVGGWIESAWGKISSAAGKIEDLGEDAFDELDKIVKDPLSALKAIFKKVTNSNKGVWKKMAKYGGNYVSKAAKDWFKKTLEKLDLGGAGAGNPGGAGVKRWTSYIKKAASAMHVDLGADGLRKILNTINHESGGNPTITQGISDINSQEGHPAIGLVQFIPSTFAHYAVKGHTNIRNGYDQLLALFNDVNWFKDLAWSGGWGPSGRRRMDSGGWQRTPATVDIAEHNPEIVINPTKSNAVQLAGQALAAIEQKQPGAITASTNGNSAAGGLSQAVAEKILELLGIIADNTGQSLTVEELNKRIDNINMKKLSRLTATS